MDCFRKRWLNCKSFVPLFGPRHRPVPWRPCEDTWSGAFHCHGLPRKNDHFHVSSWQKVEVIIQWSSAFHLEDWKASIARQLGHLFFCPELDKAPNAARHKHWKWDPIIPTQSVLNTRATKPVALGALRTCEPHHSRSQNQAMDKPTTY